MPRRAVRLPALAFLIAWSPAAPGVEVGAGGGEDAVPLRTWSAPPFYAVSPSSRDADGVAPPPGAAVTAPLVFVGTSPCRVADTREPLPGTFMLPGVIRDFAIAGSCSIPLDAEAVSFNFTVTETSGPGFLLVYPAGGPTPLVSTLNFVASQTVANAAVVPLGLSQVPGLGKGISVIPGVSGFHLVIDVNGYYTAQGVVSSLNGLTGPVTVTAGANVTVTPSGQDVQVSAGPLVSSLEGLTGAVDVEVSGGVILSAGSGTLGLGTNATSSATASTLVARDASAGFAAGTVELSGSPNLLATGAGLRLLHRTGHPSNLFFGPLAGGTATTAALNTAFGSAALGSSTTGSSNSAFGAGALGENTAGASNSAFGNNALALNTQGSGNSAFGAGALQSGTNAGSNSAFGVGALANTTTSFNSAFGASALVSNSTGAFNSAFGASALLANTTGSGNSAFGTSALSANTTGNVNVAFGQNTLLKSTTGTGNTAVGAGALQESTTAGQNSAFGWVSLTSNTTGSENAAFGAGALGSNTTGSGLAAFGASALAASTTATGNSAFGWSALAATTTGSGNSAFGSGALMSNTTAAANSAFGAGALTANTVGEANSAFGLSALRENLGGAGNSAFGYAALRDNTGGSTNSAFGSGALEKALTAAGNSAFGHAALDAATTGGGNTAVGVDALGTLTTGIDNVAVGNGAGAGLTSGSNNVYIGSGVVTVQVGETNTVRIGNGSTAAYVQGIFGATATGGSAVFVTAAGKLGTATSSARFKEEIADLPDPAALLLSLRPVSFVYRGDERRTAQAGLVAEEVDAVAPHLVVRDGNGDVVSVRYDQLVPLLLAEAQRLERENASLRKAVEALAGRVTALEGTSGPPSAPAR